MLRQHLTDTLKTSMKSGDKAVTATIRLILAAIKDRDIAERSKDNRDGISDQQILSLLQSMIKQRRESIELYAKGGRLELAEQEEAEITIIESFLPQQMPESEVAAAVDQVVGELGASCLKDMGSVMAALRERYAGRMDFARASALTKKRLA